MASTPSASGSPIPAYRNSVMANLRELLLRRETIGYLVSSNLRAGHRDKLLGNLWNLLDPLLFMAVYYVVFGIGFRQAGENPTEFVIYLCIGLLSFRFLDGVVIQSATCIRANRGIVGEMRFPKAVLPISVCLSRLYDFLWGLVVLGVVLAIIGHPITVWVVGLPLLIGIQLLLCMGLAFATAYIGAFFADTPNILGIATRLLFFSSPIFYFAKSEHGRHGIVPPEYLDLYSLNPLVGLFDGYRDVMLWGRMPAIDSISYLAVLSVAVFVFGFLMFSRGERDFAKYL